MSLKTEAMEEQKNFYPAKTTMKFGAQKGEKFWGKLRTKVNQVLAGPGDIRNESRGQIINSPYFKFRTAQGWTKILNTL